MLALNAQQQEVAAKVRRVVLDLAPRYGLHPARALVVALWGNAWGESRMGLYVTGGDNGTSHGVFQLHAPGAGSRALGQQLLTAGWSLEDLKAVDTNTAGIVWACSRSAKVREALRSGTLGDATAAVTTDVERPANMETRAQERIAYAEQLTGLSRDTLCQALA